MLYTWQKTVVEGAARAFEGPGARSQGNTREAELVKRMEHLEAKLVALIGGIISGLPACVSQVIVCLPWSRQNIGS